jgi:uncharacterized membrane protein (UPF0136 family)
MQPITRLYLFAYALLLIIGGLLGGGSGSMVSVIAGVGCGLIAGVGAFLMGTNPKVGLFVADFGAFLALGGMLPRFLKSHAIWPAGTIAIASGIALLLCGVNLISVLQKK